MARGRTFPNRNVPNSTARSSQFSSRRRGNTDVEIGGLSISDPPTQAKVQALRDKCEELDLVHRKSALRGGEPVANPSGKDLRRGVRFTTAPRLG